MHKETETIKLYHGTSEDRWDEIQRTGLEPRGARESQWEEFPSRSDMVYFSVVCPFYHALKTTVKGRCAVLEIDSTKLDESKFHPDEDSIAGDFALRTNTPLKTIHSDIRDKLEQYRHEWPSWLEKRGNCCYKGTIPVSAISRVCLFDSDSRPFLKEIAADPYNSDAWRFQEKGIEYKGLVAWFFGDEPELPSPYLLPVGSLPPEAAAKIEQCRKESQDRTGIEIVELNYNAS